MLNSFMWSILIMSILASYCYFWAAPILHVKGPEIKHAHTPVTAPFETHSVPPFFSAHCIHTWTVAFIHGQLQDRKVLWVVGWKE